MTNHGDSNLPAHAVLTRVLDWHQLRTLLSEGILGVPTNAPDRWQRVADLVNARCPNSRPQSADVFEHVVDEIARLDVPGAERLAMEPSAGRDIWTRVFYDAVHSVLAERLRFLNFGYDGPAERTGAAVELEQDELSRSQMRLYDRLIGDTPLDDRRILEIGCGRGGGCGFMAGTFSPRLVVGLDLVESNIATCRRHRSTACEQYIVGNATELPFAAGSFDVVVNVESSHNYRAFDRFVQEVYRVLTPGGSLLFGDFRPSAKSWNKAFGVFRDAGFFERGVEDISDGVLRAIESQEARDESALRRHGFDDTSLANVSEAILFFRSNACERMSTGDARFMTATFTKVSSL